MRVVNLLGLFEGGRAQDRLMFVKSPIKAILIEYKDRRIRCRVLCQVHVKLIAVSAGCALDIPIVGSHANRPILTAWILAGSLRADRIFNRQVEPVERDVALFIVARFLLRLGWLWQIILRRRGGIMGRGGYGSVRLDEIFPTIAQDVVRRADALFGDEVPRLFFRAEPLVGIVALLVGLLFGLWCRWCLCLNLSRDILLAPFFILDGGIHFRLGYSGCGCFRSFRFCLLGFSGLSAIG